MMNDAKQMKKAYVQPVVEVREGFEKNVLQSGCLFQALSGGGCGWQTPTG
ncbi:MAG: hypothetical protein ABIK09_21160 [Pseudomonadota bacterium]